MTWDYFLSQGIDLNGSGRIARSHAERQKRTANEILKRLQDQPGVVLADEVGMGKTYVALSVALSIALLNKDAGPVVVMVPPSVKDKWPRDLKVFLDKCLKPAARVGVRATERTIESGVDFLRLLDDAPEHRQNLIFMTHGALSRGLTDRHVKLALVQRACEVAPSLEAKRSSLHRFVGGLLRHQAWSDELWFALLAAPTTSWRSILAEHGKEPDDDPVPAALAHVLAELGAAELKDVIGALQRMPTRDSASSRDRVDEARALFNDAVRDIWQQWLVAGLKKVDRLPLLIVDEAHHLKNPGTRLASLFMDEGAENDQKTLAGPLNGVFERMLFLTATPFQLGHGELLRVLERFENVDWQSDHAPVKSKAEVHAALCALRAALDHSQTAARGFSDAWARLRPELVVDAAGLPVDVNVWWQAALVDPAPSGTVGNVVHHWKSTLAAVRAAEAPLQPWVIRHAKPRFLEGGVVPRRRAVVGAGIIDEARSDGIAVEGDALLPFLLAARAQALVSNASTGRALFAEGLASSYEAYRETRLDNSDVDEDDDARRSVSSSDTLEWYLNSIEEALPRGSMEQGALHPKMQATVRRVLQLWEAGEKVLVFCHYRATGRALERHISRAMDAAITSVAARRFGLDGDAASARLERLGKRLQQPSDPLRKALDEALGRLVRESGVADVDVDPIVEVMRRFFRTPALLARCFPADEEQAVERAFAAADSSGQSLDAQFRAFCRFLGERETEERAEYMDALRSVQTGERYERDDDGEKEQLLPNVRLANGSTKDDTRRRLLVTFNTPFYPEVLVASSVLAEGVDLHLNCRFIIHHDLCWNPSTLEQRTGRVDRLGAKAERAKDSIRVYQPYIAETQDEKMFRVVQERERWFQVVMGEKFGESEAEVEKEAARVSLPAAVATELAFRLQLPG
jgi:ERCC4-related helicase